MNGEMVFTEWQTSLKSAHTKTQYVRSIRQLEAFTGEPWWQTSPAAALRFKGYMKRELKLSDATIAVRLSAGSSLFSFAMKMREGDGTALCQANPFAVVERPEVRKFDKVGSLDAEQVKALLQAIVQKIRRSQGTRQVVHLRNYALILFYLFTGKRNSEVCRLQWAQIRRGPRFAGRPEKVEIQWHTKGDETKWAVLPEPVWGATWAYLERAGRTNLEPDDYVFVALDETPYADGVDMTQPLADRTVRVIVKRYAERAHLTHVTVHMLRHSSAMLLKAVGASAMDIQEHLGHSNLNTTQIYLDQLSSYENKHWTKVADLLGIPSDNTPYRRGNVAGEKLDLRKGYPMNIRRPRNMR